MKKVEILIGLYFMANNPNNYVPIKIFYTYVDASQRDISLSSCYKFVVSLP